MSADAVLNLNNNVNYLHANGVTIEQTLNTDSMFVYKHNHDFELPLLDYSVDFDFFILDVQEKYISFQNNDFSQEGSLFSNKYGKKGFTYDALDVTYSLISNELCVESVFPLSLKKFLLQPDLNRFCFQGTDFPLFKNATLIKERRFLKDKLYNNVDVKIQPSLKVDIINK